MLASTHNNVENVNELETSFFAIEHDMTTVAFSQRKDVV